jgi:hypothetical protein
MTESEWLGGTNLAGMLEHLAGTVSERKLRLFASACCRAVVRGHQDVFEVAAAYADGKATAHQLAAARFAGRFQPGHPAWAVAWSPDLPALHAVGRVLSWAAGQRANASGWWDFVAVQADILREVIGNPFRPVRLDPAWLAGSDGAAVKLAEVIYAERRFAEMPILADALEEAGCTDLVVLEHLRQQEEHVRGCWVVDHVLGKA